MTYTKLQTNLQISFPTFDLDLRQATTTQEKKNLGKEIVKALQQDSLIQIKKNEQEDLLTANALMQNKLFFSRTLEEKKAYTSDLTYTGYVYSGEEKKGGQYDLVELYTVFPDIQEEQDFDIPCHGPAIYPTEDYKQAITTYMKATGDMCDILLELIGLGLNYDDPNFLKDIAKKGFHHSRNLRFKSQKETSGASNGISAHSDYGFLIAASQDDVGGLYVRPIQNNEYRGRNWLDDETTIGAYNNDPGWAFVTPKPSVWTVFVGDMLELATQGSLRANLHKVKLHPEKERFAIAYFHEPRFNQKFTSINSRGNTKQFTYGEHLTKMYTKAYPTRPTTTRILQQNLMTNL
ncbi:isopenicillin N synthase family oxygenase [Planktothricoides raciborskii]|uniref:Isopenicillin N synthase family oxygenase n=1 Tax=Planktothricoides raciborskii FACHB-1370 TaxID=2949576 RepID=A0ABR8EAD1_9CYAN|nr:isopenicillin N synthase family oxygenase [Planktothricoides raciborskii]MBD2543606.1 isopenicillin N synthase family oxygenase [Planktothricoides raciborskii FACHB-1370]MBD2581296.1 isopenicillin N synthase family oxygenase [Planktothricoides raciborskii FACHB-1261]